MTSTWTLSSKGWRQSNHDQVLLSAPCKSCKRMVTIRRSGTDHVCEKRA